MLWEVAVFTHDYTCTQVCYIAFCVTLGQNGQDDFAIVVERLHFFYIETAEYVPEVTSDKDKEGIFAV